MYAYLLGWHWKHAADLKIERPNGHFGMQLIVVQSNARVIIGQQEFRAKANTAFLIRSCVPHCLYADGEPYTDDWIRFSAEQDDYPLLDHPDMPWHTPVPLHDSTVSDLIRSADTVFRSELPNKNRILHHILSAALLSVRESCRKQPAGKQTFYDKRLEELRRSIYANPGKDWSIPEIAEGLCISVSHFQRLYKQHCGVSCTQDVFMSRMEYAKQLLMETDLTANEIAQMCGYQNYENFSRTFAKYACMPPVKYRRRYCGPQENGGE